MNRTDFSVFTVCNIAYLPKALVLADTLYEHHNKMLNVVLFDKKQIFPLLAEKINIVWVEDLGLHEWRQLAFMYDIIEFSTSLKPYIALKLMEENDNIIFLDPDTAIYSSLDPILRDLDEASVVLTPHYIKPQPRTSYESDLPMMRFGSFNLGFFAIRRGEEAAEFLNWWNQRCIDFSFMETQFGLSTDQKWVSIAPCFFDYLKISFNPGYNAAAWNTFERTVTRTQSNDFWVNDKYRLVFFHFSNFNHKDPQYLLKRASSEIGYTYAGLEELGCDYSRRLIEYENKVDRVPYAFDYMSDGTYISPTLRRAYASIKDKLPLDHDPFNSDGVVGLFARRNRLVTKTGIEKYEYPSVKQAQSSKTSFAFIYFAMRAFLRIAGPYRFYDLSKLMVYLSLFRMDHKYWKLQQSCSNRQRGNGHIRCPKEGVTEPAHPYRPEELRPTNSWSRRCPKWLREYPQIAAKAKERSVP
jgi:hypothetical protein